LRDILVHEKGIILIFDGGHDWIPACKKVEPRAIWGDTRYETTLGKKLSVEVMPVGAYGGRKEIIGFLITSWASNIREVHSLEIQLRWRQD